MQISKKKKNHLSIHNQGEPLLQVGMYQSFQCFFPHSSLPPPPPLFARAGKGRKGGGKGGEERRQNQYGTSWKGEELSSLFSM